MDDSGASAEPTPAADTAELWVLALVAEPGEVPVARRVAQVLKYAKRVHGLRCVALRDRFPTAPLSLPKPRRKKARPKLPATAGDIPADGRGPAANRAAGHLPTGEVLSHG